MCKFIRWNIFASSIHLLLTTPETRVSTPMSQNFSFFPIPFIHLVAIKMVKISEKLGNFSSA